jgi:hypothetical protein
MHCYFSNIINVFITKFQVILATLVFNYHLFDTRLI